MSSRISAGVPVSLHFVIMIPNDYKIFNFSLYLLQYADSLIFSVTWSKDRKQSPNRKMMVTHKYV